MKIGWRRKVAVSRGNGEPVAATTLTDNPYIDARRNWNSQVEKAFSSVHVWQMVGICGLLIGMGGVAGIAYIGSQSKFVPYVIEVDKLGEAVSVGPAQLAGPADPRVVRASLASFVASIRLVTPDVEVERKAVFTAYAMVKTKDPAALKLNEWFESSKESDPFERAKKVTVSTEINSVLPISQNSWQCDWMETTRDRDGALVAKPAHWRAVLDVYILPPSTHAQEAEIQRNPLGIFVRDWNWQEL